MATDMTAEQAEKYVRESWNEIRSFESASGPWHICDGTEELEIWRNSEAEAWLAAAEYTRAHAQKIAEVRDEIDFLNFAFSVQDRNEDRGIVERILAREQAALDELLLGWREK